jgi:hypothetical protein
MMCRKHLGRGIKGEYMVLGVIAEKVNKRVTIQMTMGHWRHIRQGEYMNRQ